MADRKLFIGNLVRRITQEDLWILYSTFGPLEECAKFHESFGFVRFLHAEDARRALDATHGIILKGRCIKVEFAATTTSWRSANNSYCKECRSSTRYNIPPIRAVDLKNHRNHHHHPIVNTSSTPLSSLVISPIGHRRKRQLKSISYESNSSEIRQSNISTLSSPSSYCGSSSHIGETDDNDCDLDSGYNDEPDVPRILSSSATLIPPSPWHDDTSVTDEMPIWDFQLYADIAHELPSIQTDDSSFESNIDDDNDDDDDGDKKFISIDCLTQLNLEDYL